MKRCPSCSLELPEISRYCTHCGTRVDSITSPSEPSRKEAEQLNLNVLYGMVAVLALALLIPPWETPPSQAPEFLGFHFILSPPEPDAVVSRMLLTVELITIAIAGLYGAFLFRRKP